MARVLIGLTGGGKSNKFAQEIMSIIDDGSLISDAKIYIIVPDQYTVSTEKFYLDILGEQRFSNVRLMSFKRLANHVFKQVGGRYNCISKCSRNALCAMAVTAAMILNITGTIPPETIHSALTSLNVSSIFFPNSKRQV